MLNLQYISYPNLLVQNSTTKMDSGFLTTNAFSFMAYYGLYLSLSNMQPELNELDPSVSDKRDEVTNEPCIALNRDPPKTAATPYMEWMH